MQAREISPTASRSPTVNATALPDTPENGLNQYGYKTPLRTPQSSNEHTPMSGTMRVDSKTAAIAKARAQLAMRNSIAEQREIHSTVSEQVSVKKKQVFHKYREERSIWFTMRD